ncbi:hypothetical protein GUJ93_ZPchr0015g6792 [Zizania palustris]|uniref:Uncharacterized protein n=1 Tax=Zizania palustris TaxID=103762 RepID=A0A8J5W6Z4_ZIZPA|nr:hypothetical protein GUJ93_ZPchr0015g6792 [Zizania palustris]
MEPSGDFSEATDAEVPLAAEAPNAVGQLPSSPALGGGPIVVSGVEVKRSGHKAVTACSELRAVTMDSEAVAPQSTSTGSESEGSQAHRRDWGDLHCFGVCRTHFH